MPKCSFKKSSSLPNIKETLNELSENPRLEDSHQQCHTPKIEKLPLCHIPEPKNTLEMKNESIIQLSSTIDCNTPSTSTEQKITQQPAFNLVKLFIQQKSSSTDTCMDVSSGCWPSSDGSSNSSIEKDPTKKKIMNDSGKSSSISRHDNAKDHVENDDQSFQLDSLDICDNTLTEKVANNTKPYKEVPPKIQMKNHHICNIINNNYFRNQTMDDNKRLDFNMITKSIQTSNYSQSRLKFVPPSFLANLSKLGEEKKAPVYVIYPNYALPDLNFVNSSSSDIFFTPFKLEPVKHKGSNLSRPYEDEDLNLTNINTDHIKDWKSLITLLPAKYRRKLKHIPEATIVDIDLSLKPMFCMSPPIKRNKMEMCDCLQYIKQQTVTSSSSGFSDRPPSSGYRGSSTMMTDSELNSSNLPT